MTKKKFYVTTPIYYPTGKPHIGTAYTTIAADILARWHRLKGEEVFALTGTDENAKKVFQTAQKAGKDPKKFIDDLAKKFKQVWDGLGLEFDRFIRTTDPDHIKVVREILQKAYDSGDIYKGFYEGYYCVECEAYYTEKDLENGCCPIHKKKVDKLKEESYFFKLSKYQKRLIEFYEKNPDFIVPKSRRNEILGRVKEGLKDLSISRKDYGWGIKLPFDKTHVAYVWYDALVNYYTATRKKGKEKFWPADVHLVGKDILWFHSVIWPAILFSVGVKPPKQVFAHGWWTFNKEKISKSRGKLIDPLAISKKYGNDSLRYFLFRATPFGQDGDFSEKILVDRHNNELADKLGNLVSRVAGLIEKNCGGKYPTHPPKNNALIKKLNVKKIEKLFDNYELDKVLNEIFAFIDVCNEYVQSKKPWETGDKKVLYELKESILEIARLLSPFIPETSEKITKQFSAKKIKKGKVLFKKI